MAVTRARLFGLTIASDFPLPGLVPASERAPVDVTVRLGPIEGEPDLDIPDAARFRVCDGREIVIDAYPGAPERNIRLFLLGSAFGLILHQRQLLPLHANAVAVGEGAIAVAGPSGAGKSTLAAWLQRSGRPLVGDDVIVMRLEAGQALAYPGVPRLRLWDEALGALGLGNNGLERSYMEEGYDKFDLPVPHAALATEGLPLHGLYVLETGPEIAIDPIGGAAAVQAFVEHTYRGEYVADVGSAQAHWVTAVTLAGLVPVYRLTRPRDLTRLAALGEALLAHAGAARTSA
ncbi:HPr kinase/phosphatase C-terminal domain-containing protein [Sphingomonas rosea]|uniref:HPr kinase/phosphatase C-terminal domain-containing protein n=1 Tax=Sphingomonas rosea TaxID=335605 RepID=A0ABP7UCM0_9SPHN